MKFKHLLLAALCLLCGSSFAQSTLPQIFLTNSYATRFCANSQVRIPVQIYGEFNDGNRFSVELTAYYDQKKQLGTYQAVLKNGALVFNIGSEITETYNEVNFRIVTTSPVTQTGYISTNWLTRGRISLSRPVGQSDTLNAGMSYLLDVNFDANNPVTITLSDSSVRELRPNGYPQSISLVASKSEDIFIVKAVNSCNVPVPFSGKAPVVINPVSIIPLKINNQTALCEGSEMELSYAVSGGTIPDNARFRLRFFKPYGNGNEQRVFEVAATKKADGILVARIPEFKEQYSAVSNVAIVVDKPGLVSPYFEALNVYAKPTASFRSQSESARIGEVFTMWLNVAGPEPYTVELTNGVSYALDNNRLINVYPLKTETYAMRSLRTGCGVTTDVAKQTIVATVPAGIAIRAAADRTWQVCENQKLRLPFVTNATFTSSTTFTVEGLTYNNTAYQFEGKLVNDSIEFLIPNSPAEWITEGYFNIKGFRIKTTSPALTSAYQYGFNVLGIPRIDYQTYQSRTLTGAGYFEYALLVSGGTPYNVFDSEGQRAWAEYSGLGQTIFVPKTGAYGPKSVQNACYSNSDLAKINLTVNPYSSQAPKIIVHPPTQRYFCNPDSLEVSFEAPGQFEAGNEFQIGVSGNSSVVLLTVSKAGRYKIPASMLNVPDYVTIQVRSTKPAMEVNAGVPVILASKPVLQYPGELTSTTLENPRIFGMDGIPGITTSTTGYLPYSAEFSDGTKNYHFEQQSQYDSFRPVFPKNKVTSYTLKSVTNACGTTDFNLTTYLYWIGYSLSMKFVQDNKIYCTGEEMVLPFNVERGSAPAGTNYLLQIGRDGTEYATVASSTTLQDFRFKIPDSMEGAYYVRVRSSDGIDSEGKRFYVNKTPSGNVTPHPDFPTEIDYGQLVYINYNLTGAGPWQLLINGQGNVTATGSPFTQNYTLSHGAVFELKSVSNQCGYGSVSGSVAVKVRPKIVRFEVEKTTLCLGEKINVKYEIGGDIPAGEKVRFYLANSNRTQYDLASVTTTTGNLALSVPATLPGESYSLVCSITGSDISDFRQVVVVRTPDIELTGSTTINPGENAFLLVRSTNAGNGTLDFTLSDGTKLNGTFWGAGATYPVIVKPGATTVYTILAATGRCGNAKVTGSATVTVNPVSARTIRITGINKFIFCEKDTMQVNFSLTGTFSAGNQFSVQFYDGQGKLVTSLPATGKESPLRVIIPAGFSTTETYRIRIGATDANTASGDFQQMTTFGTKATASFASSTATVDAQGIAKAVVVLTGTGPWRYAYGNDLGAVPRYATVSPDTLLIMSKEMSATFRLLNVNNGCGVGVVNEPSLIRVDILLAAEEPGQEIITFGPNPTNGRVMLYFKASSKRELTLYNSGGMLISTKQVAGTSAEMDMQDYPSGSYLLKIKNPKGEQVLRVVKE